MDTEGVTTFTSPGIHMTTFTAVMFLLVLALGSLVYFMAPKEENRVLVSCLGLGIIAMDIIVTWVISR